ncbi:hypothetical protein CANARDRAFT_29216 [[Candida] arabinofermentans NRRL YB-2248]|uniref:Ada DNA repair metal-binding domain-containing protein n=1 Tax=[Candida] arabinofermentans NRRL YB-2248 TaxID=983967 RepID=A0A1E4SXW6_9ASCO|nr:hypothetical protein CANARDRAFT_29216 [[Candida] arabinofermentans NRRL YB-2248]
MYASEQSKWVAFQFKDPFAANEFLVCNVAQGVYCRPNCDLGFSTISKKEVSFVDTIDQAVEKGCKPCKYCLPDENSHSNGLNEGSFVSIDLTLLVQTVEYVNEQIGFIKPLMKEDSEKSLLLKETIWKSKNANLRKRISSGFSGRNGSTSQGSNSAPDDLPMTRNEFDHLKLIDLACRHIALAAISTSLGASLVDHSEPSNTRRASSATSQTPMKKKRRRGGVLGFKELAAKSNLSPWHFHRVFKSVTGLTPKTYGDKCWAFINKLEERDPSERSRKNSIIINTRIANPTVSAEDNNETVENVQQGATLAIDSKPTILDSKKKVKKSQELHEQNPQMLFKSNFNLVSSDKLMTLPAFDNAEESSSPLDSDVIDHTSGNIQDDVPSSSSATSLFSIYDRMSVDPINNLVQIADDSTIFKNSAVPEVDSQMFKNENIPEAQLSSMPPSSTSSGPFDFLDDYSDLLAAPQTENQFYLPNQEPYDSTTMDTRYQYIANQQQNLQLELQQQYFINPDLLLDDLQTGLTTEPKISQANTFEHPPLKPQPSIDFFSNSDPTGLCFQFANTTDNSY